MKVTQKLVSQVNDMMNCCPWDYVEESLKKIGTEYNLFSEEAFDKSTWLEIDSSVEFAMEAEYESVHELSSLIIFYSIAALAAVVRDNHGAIANNIEYLTVNVKRSKDKLLCMANTSMFCQKNIIVP